MSVSIVLGSRRVKIALALVLVSSLFVSSCVSTDVPEVERDETSSLTPMSTPSDRGSSVDVKTSTPKPTPDPPTLTPPPPKLQPEPTEAPLSETASYRLVWSGVGNASSLGRYLKVVIELQEGGDLSLEEAQEKLEKEADDLLEACPATLRESLTERDFLLISSSYVSAECIDYARGKVQVYNGVPQEAVEDLMELDMPGQEDYAKENGWFWLLSASQGLLAEWRWVQLPIEGITIDELKSRECFQAALKRLGWSGEDFAIVDVRDRRVGETRGRYGLGYYEPPRELPKFCTSATLMEVSKPPWVEHTRNGMHTFTVPVEEGMPLSFEVHTDPRASSVKWEVPWPSETYRIVRTQKGERRAFGYDMTPWTLIHIFHGIEDHVYLTFDGEGNPRWYATEDWSSARAVAEINASPKYEGSEPAVLAYSDDLVEQYWIVTEDGYESHIQQQADRWAVGE